ncbi:MAG: DUF1295 domain-containing protein [Betaproteobacteria bacterium]
MPDVHALLIALGAMVIAAVLTWLLSIAKKDVSIVDSAWSLLFLLGALTYAANDGQQTLATRGILISSLLVVWGSRLCLYITWRNWGEGEDRRYQAIRARNEPGFAWKSLYLVFTLQAVLAWLIAMPVFAGLTATSALNVVDGFGVTLWLVGFAFESVGDGQLARFKADPANHGKVLDVGLWRFTRHPNYFGEATQWWGFYLLATAAGAWWTVFAPVLMTFMLLKVSGVSLLEKDIGERRPAYRAYIERTSAFVPWPPTPDAPHAGGGA